MFIREIEALRGVIRQETATRPPALAVVRRVNGRTADLHLTGATTLLRGVPVPEGARAGQTVEVTWQGNQPAISLKGRAIAPTTVTATGNLPTANSTAPTQHRQLAGLGADDHPHYLTSARADLRFAPLIHTHSGYAAATALTAHTSNLANPHGVTAAQAGAVAKTGDTMTGSLTIQPAANPALTAHGHLMLYGATIAPNSQVRFYSLDSTTNLNVERARMATERNSSMVQFASTSAGWVFAVTVADASSVYVPLLADPANGGRLRVGGISGITTTAPQAKLHVFGTRNEIQTIVQGVAFQSVALHEWRNSGGTPLASIGAAGHLTTPRYKEDATGIGFFGKTPAAQQTGGAATAGSTYTTTEQSMLNAIYTALRAYGLLS